MEKIGIDLTEVIASTQHLSEDKKKKYQQTIIKNK